MPATTAKETTKQWRDFSKGVNQTDARQALQDNECFWLENVQPIGKGQLKLVPPKGATLTTIGVGISSLWGRLIKIGGVEVARLFTINADGSATQIDPVSGTKVTMASAGTFQTTARMEMWQDSPLLLIDPVQGYYQWDGTTLTHLNTPPQPATGNDVTTFEGRACLVTAPRSVTLSSPQAFTNFVTASGSTVITITDSVFAGSITRLLSALEVLWVIGPAAVNAISNIQFAAGTTTFSNTNIVANVGSLLPSSVTSFFRTFLFLTPYGVYAIVGATPQKLSDQLDGLFPKLTLGSDAPAGIATINSVFVWCVLVTYADPLNNNATRPILLCLSRNAWFVASQGNNLTWIASLVNLSTGNPELWGTDGMTIFKCFAGTGAGFYDIQTKFYDFGAFYQEKQGLRLKLDITNPTIPIDVHVTITNESQQVNTVTLSPPVLTIIFTGAGGVPITFTGAGGVPIIWTTGSTALQGDVNLGGDYLGIRITGTSNAYTLAGIALELDQQGEWT